jgi:hypothetical protein
MHSRSGTGPRYTYLSTQPSADGDRTLHRHGAGKHALTHEHALGRGQHRHDDNGERRGDNWGAAFAGHRVPQGRKPGAFS